MVIKPKRSIKKKKNMLWTSILIQNSFINKAFDHETNHPHLTLFNASNKMEREDS